VEIDAADADEIAETVMLCPTGALHFERLDGGDQESPWEPTMVEPRPNGPLFVRGRFVVRQADGELREETRAALCRCGGSANKPFCDGTHKVNGFRAEGTTKL
jgi:CDGSH-type Zn-finger protein